MKKKIVWKVLLFIGLCPFLAPILLSPTRMGSWTLIDWLVLWSYVYWPTYIIGLIVLGIAIYKLKKANRGE